MLWQTIMISEETIILNASAPFIIAIPIAAKAGMATESVVLADNDGHYTCLQLNGNLKPWIDFFQSTQRVILFDDAKTLLRLFLQAGIDIARPICLKTLKLIVYPKEQPQIFPAARTISEAAQLAKKALASLEEIMQVVEKQYRQLARLENLVLRPFASMEHHGIYVDYLAWVNLIQEAKQKLIYKREAALQNLAFQQSVDLFGNCTVNLDSGKEVKEALECVMGQALNDTHYMTLSRLSHPAAKAILQYREVAKLVQNYGDNFLCHVNMETSRIHATFEPIGASTGRVACRSPNLQNLPSEEAFHRCLTAPEGKSLITADYAACELKILASLSQDPVFLELFSRDVDLHSEVAQAMFNIPVSKEQNVHLRQRAKAINFGLMYGMGFRALARNLQIREEEAEALFEQYFKTYPKVKSYLDSCVEKVMQHGYIETVLGRRFVFDKSDDISRLAKNMPIQGTGAEIAKLALIRIHQRLTTELKEAFLVNMIHDELVVECLDKDTNTVALLVQEEMENAQRSLIPNVKPKAEVHIGKYWQH